MAQIKSIRKMKKQIKKDWLFNEGWDLPKCEQFHLLRCIYNKPIKMCSVCYNYLYACNYMALNYGDINQARQDLYKKSNILFDKKANKWKED